MSEITEREDEETPTLRPKRTRITKPSGQATVREVKTISYNAEIPDDDEPKTQTFRPYQPQGFRPFTPDSGQPKNTISNFFDVLSNESDEAFLLFITRLPDMPSERFFLPQALYPANFPVVQISKYDAPNFVQMLTNLNSNSGGRFTIRACRLDGEAIEDAVLNNFVVPNPQRDEVVKQNDSGLREIVAVFERMAQQQEQRFTELISTLANKPVSEPSEWDLLAKEMLRKKLLEDAPKADGFNPERYMEALLTSEVIMDTITSKFASRLSDNKSDENEPTWLKLLESDTGKVLIEKAGNIANSLAVIGASKLNAPAPAPQQQQQPVQNPDSEENTRMTIDTTKLTQFILDELESDNPINGDNAVLKELSEDYPKPFTLLIQFAKTQTFEQLFTLLHTFVPEAFVNLQDETGALTESGQKIQKRLQELYEYLKTLD